MRREVPGYVDVFLVEAVVQTSRADTPHSRETLHDVMMCVEARMKPCGDMILPNPNQGVIARLVATAEKMPMKTFNSALFAGFLFATGLIALPLKAQNFTFTTIAGGSQGSNDGVGSSAQFFQPTGVAADGAGNVYVADQ